jgi:hypothetical protein
MQSLDFATILNTVNELYAGPIHDVYLPTLYDLCWRRRTGGAMLSRIPRSSKGVKGLKVKLDFILRKPWAWGALSEFGFTPTGSKFDFDSMEAALGCHATAAGVSLHQMAATEQGEWTNIIEKNIAALGETLPYYMQGQMFSSQNSYHAIAQVVSVATVAGNIVVTLDNAGLYYTGTRERCKLIQDGMWLQALRSGVRVGSPFRVEGVDPDAGTIIVDVDPGLADNDVLTFSDVAGLDTRYSTVSPGIPDVFDDDNTFQGKNRALATNIKFRPVTATPAANFPTREELRRFLQKLGDPAEAFCHWDFLEAYRQQNIDDLRRYVPGQSMQDGGEKLMIGRTALIDDDDVPRSRILVPDTENWRIVDRGGMENLFGKGWQQIAGRPMMEYVAVLWLLLLAEDTRYFGDFNGMVY